MRRKFGGASSALAQQKLSFGDRILAAVCPHRHAAEELTDASLKHRRLWHDTRGVTLVLVALTISALIGFAGPRR